MGRPVVHGELWSKDPARTSEFCTRVFDRRIQHIPELNYRMVATGGEGGIDGGIMKPQEGPWPGDVALSVDVDDLDPHKLEIPGVERLTLFEDPNGGLLGMWKRA